MEAWSPCSSKQLLLPQSADFAATNAENWLLVKDRPSNSFKSLCLLTLALPSSNMHGCKKEETEKAQYCLLRLTGLRNTDPNKQTKH